MIHHKIKWDNWETHIIMEEQGISFVRGYILFAVPNIFKVSTMSVLETKQKKGHGKKMSIYIEKYAKTLGCNRITFKVKKDSWVLDWYRKLDYEIIDAKDNWFTMEKMLN